MSDPDLRPFVTRSRALLGSDPPRTRRETRTLLVEPFLEALGWCVRSASCVTDRTLEGTRLEYVLSADSVPAVLVAVEPCPESLDESRAAALLETMAWTGIDRAIYTNGRNYLLLAGETEIERLSCQLSSLPDHESSLRHFSRESARQRFDDPSQTLVARRLAVDRSTLVDSIVEALTVSADERYADEFEAAAEQFLDRLVVSFATDQPESPSERGGISLEYTGPSTEVETRDCADGDAAEDEPTESTARADAADSSGDDAESVDDQSSDGEYVVRFFSDRGSVGAIGHSSPTQALVHTAEYCLERGLGDTSLPWGPSDDAASTLLNDRPVRADGSPMRDPHQLSNGLYLETAGDADDLATRIEALASQIGLRAMLTGDWEERRSG